MQWEPVVWTVVTALPLQITALHMLPLRLSLGLQLSCPCLQKPSRWDSPHPFKDQRPLVIPSDQLQTWLPEDEQHWLWLMTDSRMRQSRQLARTWAPKPCSQYRPSP